MLENKDYLSNRKIDWWISWPIIIITWIAFWPVGLVLTAKRVSSDRKAALGVGKVLSIIGWVFLSFALLGICVSISEGFYEDDIVFILFFLTAAIVLIAFARHIKNRAYKFKKYITIVVNQEISSIDRIASIFKSTYDIVKKDLQIMIDRGYFVGAYIDETTRAIILPMNNQERISQPSSTTQKQLKMKVVECKSCGANNTVAIGTIVECEYCGSAIQG